MSFINYQRRPERVLHLAAQFKSTEIVKALLDHGADVNMESLVKYHNLLLNLYALIVDSGDIHHLILL